MCSLRKRPPGNDHLVKIILCKKVWRTLLVCHKCAPSTLSLHEQHAGEDGNNRSPTPEKLSEDVRYPLSLSGVLQKSEVLFNEDFSITQTN